MVVNVISSPQTIVTATTHDNDKQHSMTSNEIFDLSSLRRRFASLAISCIHREYPNKIAHVLTSDADIQAPHNLTPAFFGCFDWHSAVHGHWLLARLGRIDKNLTYECRQALRKSLTKEKLQDEVKYLSCEQRQTFERPYGLAWLLQLVMELDEWTQEEIESSEEILEWRENIRSLELLVVNRLSSWLPKLSYPIRSGEHSQTAFALGLSLDYARRVNNSIFAQLIEQNSLRFFFSDKLYPFTYEPSGEDFLSAGLAEADLMRRVMTKNNYEFLQWFNEFLPFANLSSSLEPPSILDPTDPKLIHLAGLCLSRAWMLEGIIQALPENTEQRNQLYELHRRNAQAGLTAIDESHYEGGHWLGTFACDKFSSYELCFGNNVGVSSDDPLFWRLPTPADCKTVRIIGILLYLAAYTGLMLNGSLFASFVRHTALRTPPNIFIMFISDVGCQIEGLAAFLYGTTSSYLLCTVSLSRCYIVVRPFNAKDVTETRTSCCTNLYDRRRLYISFSIAIFVFVYCLPLVILLTANSIIYLEFKRMRDKIAHGAKAELSQKRIDMERRLLKSIVITMFDFIFIWTSYAVAFFISMSTPTQVRFRLVDVTALDRMSATTSVAGEASKAAAAA
ncbi:unnamed protein product, partial [Rotaria socialis]